MRKKKLHREPTKNYFPLPNCIYQLGLSAGAIAVYGYLLYIENRETYQCHASYATIGNAVGMSRNALKDSWQKVANMSNPACVPYVRRCVPLLRRQVGVDTPAGEHAAFGAFSRHFRPDIAVRKLYKIKPAIGSTGGHPQSPATRVFLSYAGCYRFREFAEFPLSICPQTPLYQRFYRYL